MPHHTEVQSSLVETRIFGNSLQWAVKPQYFYVTSLEQYTFLLN